MVAVSPGRAGIGVFSPLLDERGTPARAIKVCEELSRRFGLHVFAPGQPLRATLHETAEIELKG